MKIEERINNNFTRKNIVNTISTYQLYYQVALGNLIKETSFDQNETMNKAKDLNLDIEPQNVLNTVMKIIIKFNNEKEFDVIFDDNIKINAMVHALDDFVGKNQELTNKDATYKVYYEKIMNDEFYTLTMHTQFNDEIEDRIISWEKVITEEISLELKESANKII